MVLQPKLLPRAISASTLVLLQTASFCGKVIATIRLRRRTHCAHGAIQSGDTTRHNLRFSALMMFIFLAVDAAGFALAADTQQPQPIVVQQGQKRFADLVSPNTPNDLLRNVKIAFDHDLLSNKEFFEAKNLKRFCGGKEINTYLRNANSTVIGEISQFGNLVTPWITSNRRVDGMSCSFSWTTATRSIEAKDIGTSDHLIIPESEKSQGWISLNIITDRRLSFEEVQKVFGDDYWPSFRFRSPHESPCGPASKPHGCQEIVYKSGNQNASTSIWMAFRSDASLSELSFTTWTHDGGKVSQVIAATEVPTTQEQLLNNVQIATRYQLLLNPAFYSDENFEKFFGVRPPALSAHDRASARPVISAQKPVPGIPTQIFTNQIEYEGPFGKLSWMFEADGSIARLLLRLNPSLEWSLDNLKQKMGSLELVYGDGAILPRSFIPYNEKADAPTDPALTKQYQHSTGLWGWVDVVVDADSRPRIINLHQVLRKP